MSEATASLIVNDEELLLHPQRAVIWPNRRTVIVADTHFGKSDHFARHGIAVPAGSDESDRQRLDLLIQSCNARRLIILGDFMHAPLAPESREANDLQNWLNGLADEVEIHVVAGNHDRGLDRARLQGVHWTQFERVEPPFRFIHDAQRVRSKNNDGMFTLSGHVHPVIRLRELGKRGLRVPVFWQTASGLILPSFGMFTGGFAVSPAQGERMFAVGSSRVVPLRSP